jgi:protein tyrosine phosphatase
VLTCSACCRWILRALGVERSGYEHLSDDAEDERDALSINASDDTPQQSSESGETATTRRKSRKTKTKSSKDSTKATTKTKKKKKKNTRAQKKKTKSRRRLVDASDDDDDDDDNDDDDDDDDDGDDEFDERNNAPDRDRADAADDDGAFVVDERAIDSVVVATATAELQAHVDRLTRVGFDREFGLLDKKQNAAYSLKKVSDAVEPGNTRKNRYSDILALNHSRVKLAFAAHEDAAARASDYVNANFVAGALLARRYVSTQGPLDSTFADFWRMIWQQNSRIIVMLTREVEKGVSKCDCYWPSASVVVAYGAVRVNPCGVWRDASGQIVLRRFRIAVCEGDGDDDDGDGGSCVWRDVSHLQYLGWPDHGVPDTATPFLTLLRDVSRIERHLLRSKAFASALDLPPLVVHCSAGIGRSGTFICVHAVLEELVGALYDRRLCRRRADGGVRPLVIAARVERMRQQRYGMVQTESQFRFCYAAVLDALQSPGFGTSVRLCSDAAGAAIEMIARQEIGGGGGGESEPLQLASMHKRIASEDVL